MIYLIVHLRVKMHLYKMIVLPLEQISVHVLESNILLYNCMYRHFNFYSISNCFFFLSKRCRNGITT